MTEIEKRLAEIGDVPDLAALESRVEMLEQGYLALADAKDMTEVLVEKEATAVPRPQRLKELNLGHDPDVVTKDGGSE